EPDYISRRSTDRIAMVSRALESATSPNQLNLLRSAPETDLRLPHFDVCRGYGRNVRRMLLWELSCAIGCLQQSSSVSMAQQAGRQLLFVDDEDSIRLTLPLILQQRGFDVNVAASVAEAISKIHSQKFD